MSRSRIRSRSISAMWFSAPKPMERFPTRSSTSFSRPSKAPPQMNRMFVVSIWMKSW